MIAFDISMFLVFLKTCGWCSSHSKAFLEFISCLSLSVFFLNDVSLLVSCSASWMNRFSSLLVVGLGNSLMALMSFMSWSTPSLLIVLPAYVICFMFFILCSQYYYTITAQGGLQIQ